MKGKRWWFWAMFWMFLMTSAQDHIKVGFPSNGSLVIAGGGLLSEEIMKTFIDLAGGKDAQIVLVPTAAGLSEYDGKWKRVLTNHGATNVIMLHTDDPKEADTKQFTKALLNATGVWFTGGRQWRLADSYLNTKVEAALWNVLDRGGVIGGSSAGATIQGSYLVRGDSKTNQIMMGDHEKGFGFLENVAIDQHVLARNRQFDLFEILEKKPELLGIGIDESTAIMVQNGRFEVIGDSYVLLYDSSFWSSEGTDYKKPLEKNSRSFYFLKAGDRYDLNTLRVITQK
ncbi:MAG: cyanophycinase [Bacteroidota bacterium]